MLDEKGAKELVHDTLFPAWREERERLDELNRWFRADNERIRIPRQSSPEHRALIDLAKSPWLRLVVSTLSQACIVSGYRTPDADDNSPAWEAWKRNGFDGRQTAVHRAAFTYGYSYVMELPGVGAQGERLAVMRGVSPRHMTAVYRDPTQDEWPVYAMRVEPVGDKWRLTLLDDEAAYTLMADAAGDGMELTDVAVHAVGVVPVVRYRNQLDDDGYVEGEIEPYLPLAKRIDKTVYDRLMVQHHNSWKVRTIVGMSKPDDPEEEQRAKLKLRQDDLLIAEDPDTKIGTLPETPLDGFLRAINEDVKDLATISQTPAYALTGDLVNLSADAIVAARHEFDAKVAERRLSLGMSHEQALRLAAHIEGDADGAADFDARVIWEDTSVRSLAQAADALTKLADGLQIPPAALWEMIPGVTQRTVEEWKSLRSESDALMQLNTLLAEQAEGLNADDND